MRRLLSKTYYHLFLVATLLVLVVASLVLRQKAEELPGRSLSAVRTERAVQQVQHQMQDFLSGLPVATFNSHQRLWEHIDSLKPHPFELLVFQGYDWWVGTAVSCLLMALIPNILNRPWCDWRMGGT